LKLEHKSLHPTPTKRKRESRRLLNRKSEIEGQFTLQFASGSTIRKFKVWLRREGKGDVGGHRTSLEGEERGKHISFGHGTGQPQREGDGERNRTKGFD